MERDLLPSCSGRRETAMLPVQRRHRVQPPGYAQLLEDVVHVALHRRHLDVELLRDRLVAEVLREQMEDLDLARGEAVIGRRCGRLARIGEAPANYRGG